MLATVDRSSCRSYCCRCRRRSCCCLLVCHFSLCALRESEFVKLKLKIFERSLSVLLSAQEDTRLQGSTMVVLSLSSKPFLCSSLALQGSQCMRPAQHLVIPCWD